jgi:hypothetical protein
MIGVFTLQSTISVPPRKPQPASKAPHKLPLARVTEALICWVKNSTSSLANTSQNI